MLSCRDLHIDLETYSSVDIKKSGLFRYVESPDFEILLFGYAFDDEPVTVIDLKNKAKLDDKLIKALFDPNVTKWAHNCAFERACLSKFFKRDLPAAWWRDTMILAAVNGLPLSLEGVGEALNLQDKKLSEGQALINYFSKPCKPTASNGKRHRNLPEHAPDKWVRFIEYNRRDVEVERRIQKILCEPLTIPNLRERQVFALDARINERGVKCDIELARTAVSIKEQITQEVALKLRAITGLENPNSNTAFQVWLRSQGVYLNSLNKETVAEYLETSDDKFIKSVLLLRQSLGKTSTDKYNAMLRSVCKDGRIRGLTQYYGASRTGRWAGRLVQLQNLPQNHIKNIGAVRQLVKSGDVETLKMLFDSVPDVLSQLIRTAFVAEEGKTLLVADYAAIEARVIAYLSGEKWRQEVFAKGGDIYCASASQMFHVPVEKHGVNGELRQKGKIAELALGYGGGINALIAFGADKMGLSEQEMNEIVTNWRIASPTIPKFWRQVETAAKQAIRYPGRFVRTPQGIGYIRDREALRCKLPSGRWLSYWGAWLDDNGSIYFMSQNQTTRKWEQTQTWGGKLVENIVQAFARDCLAEAMLHLDAEGYKIVFHVHDEIIAEAPKGARWEDMALVMSEPIPWAPGLLLRADGYSTDFYMKD